VRLRPDLRIVSVDVPTVVRVNQPFTIVATIRELNGDTGARTTCILADRDDHDIDIAENIWVDAGDTVQCMFSQTLTTLGTRSFYVKVGRTRPDDWDSSVGERERFSVLATTTRQWEIAASQKTIRQSYVETFSGDPDHPLSGESTETFDTMQFSGVIDEPIDLETVTMSIEESTDGKLIYGFPTVNGLPHGPPNDGGCKFSDRRHSLYLLCRFDGGLAVDIRTIGSSALYVSHFWTGRFDPETGQNVWTRRTMSRTSRFGTPQRYGDTYQMRVSLTDADNDRWELHPFLNLVPYERPVEHSTSVRENGDYTWTTRSTYHETGKTGTASVD
jgi:hypothetical protein